MKWFESRGVSLAYQVSGQGPLVALVHEIGGSMQSFDALTRLLERQFTVLRYDQRCAGFSEKTRQPYGFEDLVDDFEALVNHLEIDWPIHLLGCAFGAPQVMRFAERRPELVASLALLAPSTDTDEERSAFMRARAETARREGLRPILDITLDRAWPPALQNSDAFRTYRSIYLANDPHGYAAHHDAFTTVNIGPLESFARHPVYIAAGTHDLVRPVQKVETIAQAIPGSQFETFEAPHFIHVHAAGALHASLTRFYSGLGPTLKQRVLPARPLRERHDDNQNHAFGG